MYGSIQESKEIRTVLTGVGVGVAGAAGALAFGPVSLVAVALLGMAGGMSAQNHWAAASKVQQSLTEDMRAKNVPIQCLCQHLKTFQF